MKKCFLLLLLFLTPLFLKSQEIDTTYNQKSFVRLHFVALGIDYEKPFKDRFSFKGGISSGVAINTDGLWLTPVVTFEQRYYFTFKDNVIPGRDDYFSGFYLSLQESFAIIKGYYALGPVFGYQKTFWKRWYFDVGLGAGYDSYTNNVSVGNVGNFYLGIILDK